MPDRDEPKTATITIEWVVGSDPADAGTYGWQMRVEPKLPDEIVSRLLTEIASGY